jgi:hypothetical protein
MHLRDKIEIYYFLLAQYVGNRLVETVFIFRFQLLEVYFVEKDLILIYNLNSSIFIQINTK